MTGGKTVLRPQYEFWFSQKAIADIDAVTRQVQYLGTGPLWVVQGPHIKPNRTFYFYVRSVNVVGKSAFVEASGLPQDDAAGILEVIKDDIVTSEAWDALSGQVNSNTSGIIETALANNADMQRWRKENGERKAEILEVRTTLVDETQAFAEKLEHVSVKLGENEAAIKTKATTVFKQNGDGKAIHSVEAGIIHDGQYDSAGIAIGAEVKDGQVKTQVLFEADRLALLNRANGQVTVPFVVQNGQVFMNKAFINYAGMTLAKVGSWYSANYVPGQSGTIMRNDGSFELNGRQQGGRMAINSDSISVYDGGGNLKVRLGKLN
ncbi:hypothetical protein SGGMMB4_02800 [Sodalis glossinidius str. 'morsitans']|uniref:Uncharacterized protein n=1 Tax=Sodalis glossinidius (strain morsitans) TaxID=343509 RepID=A0A193QJ68_SODGM|nr:DUF1983 domain-containing protein [Sodalis glossinidius]CRL45222.1 hypothetical protein SGGMMB4_02800 [Sodalis glossinidius str. 'morsitans']